jgi:hypothetical protein
MLFLVVACNVPVTRVQRDYFQTWNYEIRHSMQQLTGEILAEGSIDGFYHMLFGATDYQKWR